MSVGSTSWSATANFDLVTAMVSRTIPGPLTLIALMTTSGVFDRLPALQIYLAETNAGWMPESFYMMDDSYRLFREWYGASLAMRPSEYAAQHFWFGIVRDPVALRMRDLLPVHRLMWGSDFPQHNTKTYAECVALAREATRTFSDLDRTYFFARTAERLWFS